MSRWWERVRGLMLLVGLSRGHGVVTRSCLKCNQARYTDMLSLCNTRASYVCYVFIKIVGDWRTLL